MSTDVEVSRFREHLTLDECKALLQYSHSIPILRGFTSSYVTEHFPGWTWNELAKVFVAAGILVNRGGAPATCDDKVVALHFSSPKVFYVVWVDGAEPDDVVLKRRANDRSTGQYIHDVGGGELIASIGGVDPD